MAFSSLRDYAPIPTSTNRKKTEKPSLRKTVKMLTNKCTGKGK